MSSFAYTAYDAAGRRVRGVLIADGVSAARAQLTAEGLFPETLSRLGSGSAGAGLVPGEGRSTGPEPFWRPLWQPNLNAEARALLTRQLAVLLVSGLTVDQALEAMMGAGSAGRINRVAAELRSQIRNGRTLSAAMGQSTGAFPDYYRAVIAAGESGGNLAGVCEVLANFLEDRLTQRDKTLGALVYPLFVGAVSLVVAAVLMINVLPELTALFEQNGQTLPRITRIILAAGGFLSAYWPLLMAGGGAGLLAAAALLRQPGPRRWWHRQVLRLPVFGALFRQRGAMLYLRTLSLVLAARLPAVAALRFAHEAVDNLALKTESAGTADAVERGESLSSALSRLPSLPAVAVQMLANGERAGQLIAMAERAARMADIALSNRTQRVAALLEPVLMMGVGGLVLVVVLSVLLPIFDMQTALVN